MDRKGFTLIEMMIVVAIIAVIAAIAIPNLLAARRTANQSNAIAACKDVGGAQNMYHRTDWDLDGIHEYAPLFPTLYTQVDGAGSQIKLISEALSLAIAVPTALHGYWFNDITADGVAGAYLVGADQPDDYGICANPGRYPRSGIETYIMDTTGTVYAMDQGASLPVVVFPANPRAAGWTAAQ